MNLFIKLIFTALAYGDQGRKLASPSIKTISIKLNYFAFSFLVRPGSYKYDYIDC